MMFGYSRYLIAACALVLAFLSAGAAMSSAMLGRNPPLAMLAPIANGPAYERMVQFELAKQMASQQDGELAGMPTDIPAPIRRLALDAFSREPLADFAVAVLAVDIASKGDTAKARRLFADAHRLTRRNSFVSLWLGRDAAMVNDVADTLGYFDEVLRTNREARPIVLGQFALATTNPLFRAGMANLLKSNPPWSDEFWATAPDVKGAVKAVGELRARLAATNLQFDPESDSKLAGRLLDAREYALAGELYRRAAPQGSQVTGEYVRNGMFDHWSRLPLIDWQTYSIGDYGSEIRPADKRMLFSAIAAPGGAVARQWVSLPSGIYTLSAQLKTENRAASDEVFMRLTCQTDGASAPIDISLAHGSTHRQFTVPANCREYWLDLVAAPAESSDGFDGELSRLSIRRAS